MRILGVVLSLLALSGCAAPMAGSKRKQTSAGASCAEACAHRAQCGIGGNNLAACVADCEAISSLHTPAELASYATADCATVASAEQAFLNQVTCSRACRHRSECVPNAGATSRCLFDCVLLGFDAAQLEREYINADCSVVQQRERTFVPTAACLRGCLRAASCGVRTDLATCLPWCTQNVQRGAFTLQVVVDVEGQDCSTVRRTVQIPSSAPRSERAGSARTAGATCVGGGPPCSAFTVCCDMVRGQYAMRGVAGLCISAPSCLAPRR